MINETEWENVSYRKPKKANHNLPKKYIRKYWKEITTNDKKLTIDENKMLEEEKIANPELNIYCYCCQVSEISDIIRRTLFPCGVCYCCVGDDPTYENKEWVNTCVKCTGWFMEYNPCYNYKNNQDFK